MPVLAGLLLPAGAGRVTTFLSEEPSVLPPLLTGSVTILPLLMPVLPLSGLLLPPDDTGRVVILPPLMPVLAGPLLVPLLSVLPGRLMPRPPPTFWPLF